MDWMRLTFYVIICGGLACGQEEDGLVMDWNSCLNRCDEAYFPGRPCYCNSVCSQYENCCYDYIMECQPDQATDDSWRDFNGHSYRYFSDGSVHSKQAQQQCYLNGGMLVSINTKEEFEFIMDEVLRGRTLSAFIGGTDAETEGVWRWVDETTMPLPTASWHVWYPGEPDNAQFAEHCSVITNYRFWELHKVILESYFWRDYSCDFNPANEIQGYICESTLKCNETVCENGGSCVYVPGPEEVECVCPKPFIGDRCQYEEKEGEIWTLCGETNLTDIEGVIQSPLYPKPYPANVRCQWLIHVQAGRTLTLTIDSLEVEETKRCVFDHLSAYNGPNENSSLLFGPLCGHLSTGNNELMTSYATSSSDVVMLEFHTDTDVSYSGFSLSYTQGRCGKGSGSSGCGTPRTYTSECGDVILTHALTSQASSCHWQITVEEDKRINLTFAEFRSLDTGMNCEDGALEVYDASDASQPIRVLCGWRAPQSIYSSTNELILKMENLKIRQDEMIHISYESIDAAWEYGGGPIEVTGRSGYIRLGSSTPVYRATADEISYLWLARVPYGSYMSVSWNVSLGDSARLKVYAGAQVSIESLRYSSDTGPVGSHSLTIEYYQALIELTCSRDDQSSDPIDSCDVEFEAEFNSKEWEPEESGCFRPQFYDMTDSKATENSVVTALLPVMLVVSEDSYDSHMPGYGPGLYCKWKLKAVQGSTLTMEFIDVRIYPMSADCRHDGIVIITQDDQQIGPLCGAESLQSVVTNLPLAEATVIFYSDPSLGWRHNGVLRSLITTTATDDDEACPIRQMGEPTTQRSDAQCGIILSPNFPGHAVPGLWFWVFTPPRDEALQYSLYVYYVRGPGVQDDDCEQSFKIIEVAADAEELRLFEADILTLCGTTELFEPPSKFTLPPKQRLGIELKTISNSIEQKWEFKIAFTTQEMREPKSHPETGRCPDEYVEWRGYCYRYYQWILRHYQPEVYPFQATWQSALKHCEEDQNGTLLSVYDADEAYFILHSLQTRWFWNGAAPIIENHKLVLLGLHNKQEDYVWTSGVKLGYADWYKPRPKWTQDPITADDLLSQIIDFNIPQPTADIASLCTGFLPQSSSDSMNWVKIPCDYPLFAAGVICKQPVPPATHDNKNVPVSAISVGLAPETRQAYADSPPHTPSSPYQSCPKGWFPMADQCIAMHTEYAFGNDSDDVMPQSITFGHARQSCMRRGGDILSGDTLTSFHLHRFTTYLHIWNHTQRMGNILIGQDAATCTLLQVSQTNELDDEIRYDVISAACDDDALDFTSVVCTTQPMEYEERCRQHEFMCDNGMCISSDYVCDSFDDCKDNSDEKQCECGLHQFTCDSGSCISLSLRCDFRSHCDDGSDETNCVLEACRDDEYACDNGECVNASAVCDFRYDCVDGSDETTELCGDQCSGFQCYSGLCLDPSLRRDGITDCPGLTMEDEAEELTELLNLFTVYYDERHENFTNLYGCRSGGTYTNCHQGELQCFDRADTCVFDTEVVDESRGYSVLKSCRDGAHLKTSCGEVECSAGMYHCQNSYCIPVRKLCDGHTDCPAADDELNCQQYVCPGLFHCKDTDMCLPHNEVCDGVTQCPVHGEDEKYCSIPDVFCTRCLCDGHIAHCHDANMTSLPVSRHTGSRSLRGLYLSMNKIKNLPSGVFSSLHWLTKLVLKRNKIVSLQSKLFSDLKNLLYLDLSFNEISKLNTNTFHGLRRLRHLNLNNNRLTLVRASELQWLEAVEMLEVENNMLDNIEKGTFDGMRLLNTLHTDAYKICCVASNVETCTPEADEFSSCEDLMANSTLQISIWILGSIALMGNAFVVIWRLKTDRKKASSFFIINLGCSDFLMGVYMIIIASVDVHYRGNYIVHADSWRRSWLCQLAGVLATVSSEVSVFMLTTITIERCLTIAFPLRFGQLRLKKARIVALTGWLFCIFLSLLPLTKTPEFGEAFYGRTGVCLPFVVSSQRLPGWEYSVFIFLVLNLISFIIIFVGYTAIFVKVKLSLAAMANKSTSTTDEYALAKKLALIVVTDFLCWVPIIMIGFAALGGATIAPQVSAWIAVFILPLNSAVNPVLYTISAIDFNRAKKRRAMYSTTSKSINPTSVTKFTENSVSEKK